MEGSASQLNLATLPGPAMKTFATGLPSALANNVPAALLGDGTSAARELLRGYLRLPTARATSSPIVTSEATAWMPIAILARRLSGIVSVGL